MKHHCACNPLAVSAAVILALVASSDAGSISGTLTYDGDVGTGGRPGNKALSLDGNGDYVRTALRNLGGSELSIAYWFKGSVHRSIVRQQLSFGSYYIVGGYGSRHILSNDGETTGIPTGDGITDGAWHHVAMTWKQGTVGGWIAYLDGEVAATKDSSNIAIPDHNVDTFIGSANGTSEFTDGLVDDVAIWTRALDQSEIQAAMATPLQGDEAGLAGYWNFDDDTAKDLSPAANHGVLNGNAAIVDAADLGATGKFIVEARPDAPENRVLCLDGLDDYVVVDSLTNLSGSEITIAYWFKGSVHRSIVRQQRPIGISYIVAGYGGRHILSNDGETTGIAAGDGITDGNWHHVVMTWKQNSADGFASYLDGQPVASRNSTNAPLPTNNEPLYFGSFSGITEFADGCVDEIVIWNRALPAAEIQNGWNQPLNGDEDGLVGYWNFDDATANDRTANGHDGRLMEGAATAIEAIPGFNPAHPIQSLEAPGPYLLEGATEGINYWVEAYFDLNGNGSYDVGEWYGQFPGSPLPAVDEISAADIELYDPSTIWLKIARSGPELQLSWPEWATGTVLTSTTDLNSTLWQLVPTEVTTQDGLHTLNLPQSQAREFFRLETHR